MDNTCTWNQSTNIPASIKRPYNDEIPLQEIGVTKKPSIEVQIDPITPTQSYSVEGDDDFPPTEIDENSPMALNDAPGPIELDWEDLLKHGASKDSFISTHKIQHGGLTEDTPFALPYDISSAWEQGIIQEHLATFHSK